MSETPTVKSIKVKSPRMLADMIAWTQGYFYPDPSSGAASSPEHVLEQEHPSAETIDTVNYGKLDDDNVWTDV
jgi:hypothetical protein